MASKKRKKIAVLGGGIGALTAVYHLTESPGWQDEYEITVYQQGWRLGGKCASGRDMRPEYGSRIYEHGLHLFAGFYHHAFKTLTSVYAALDRPHDHPNRTVWDAFTGLDTVTLLEQFPQPDGSIITEPWYLNLPPNDLVPGEATTTATTAELVREVIAQLIKYHPPAGVFGQVNIVSGSGDGEAPGATSPDMSQSALGKALAWADALYHKVERKVIEEVAEVAAHVMMRTIVKEIEDHLEALAAKDTTPGGDQGVRNFLMAAYFVQTLIQGVLEDDILEKGWDSIDDEEFSGWLYRHAATIARDFKGDDDPYDRARALIDWAPIRAIYDYVFGYEDGDPNKRAVAAGTGMRGTLKLALGYRGHFFWTMRGGMGDVVIAPFYLALKDRGVKFDFFNRVLALRPSDDRNTIDKIELLEQAKIREGKDYDPLIMVEAEGWKRPLECWPDQPLWDQLVDGELLIGTDFEYSREVPPPRANRVLERGTDFDEIILGIPIGALHTICADLATQRNRWSAMLNAVKTTPTLALQLWLKRTTDDLGAAAPGRTMTAMIQPFSTWADVTHVLAREHWRGEKRPMSVAYFCGQIPPEIPRDDRAREAVGEKAKSWLQANGARQWPRATPMGQTSGFDYGLLHDPENRTGEARFDSQYWRANIDPSELYVMSVPGSTTKRLRANESGYYNLFLAGDWTRNGLNAGAAEAAAMSGIECANALMGDSNLIFGESDL